MGEGGRGSSSSVDGHGPSDRTLFQTPSGHGDPDSLDTDTSRSSAQGGVSARWPSRVGERVYLDRDCRSNAVVGESSLDLTCCKCFGFSNFSSNIPLRMLQKGSSASLMIPFCASRALLAASRDTVEVVRNRGMVGSAAGGSVDFGDSTSFFDIISRNLKYMLKNGNASTCWSVNVFVL